MTRDTEQAYARNWLETGRLLDEIRWRELRDLDPAVALRASDDLIELALRVPLPADRRTSSGLVALQDVLHLMRQDAGQIRLGFGEQYQAGIDADKAAIGREGVDLGRTNDEILEILIVVARLRGQP